MATKPNYVGLFFKTVGWGLLVGECGLIFQLLRVFLTYFKGVPVFADFKAPFHT
jgi:hypothetical protein